MKYVRKQSQNIALSWIVDLAIALVIVIILTTFFVQNLRVEGTSMSPLLENGQMVIINKWVYRFELPTRGDIIGFKNSNLKSPIVKRIIGMPGDEIDYRDQTLYLNGHPISEDEKYVMMHGGDIKYPFTVPPGHYFVLGDNHNNSIDSRFNFIGCVSKDDVIGRIDLRIWPFWHNPLLK